MLHISNCPFGLWLVIILVGRIIIRLTSFYWVLFLLGRFSCLLNVRRNRRLPHVLMLSRIIVYLLTLLNNFLWLTWLLSDLGVPQSYPTIIHVITWTEIIHNAIFHWVYEEYLHCVPSCSTSRGIRLCSVLYFLWRPDNWFLCQISFVGLLSFSREQTQVNFYMFNWI